MANETGGLDSVGEMPGVGGLGMGFEGGGAVHPAVPPPGAHPAGTPVGDDVPLATSLLYSSGNLGSGVFYAFNNFILPLFLDTLHMPAILIALLSSTRSFEGAVVQPIVGAWSDRTWTRFGRRKPFILAFVPISVFFILLTPFLPGFATLAPLVALQHALGLSQQAFVLLIVALDIFFFTLAFNIMYDPYQALLADITPLAHRGRVNGIFQALGASGQALILIIGAFLSVGMTGLFLLTGIALATFFVPTLIGIREPRHLPGVREQHRYTTRDYWNGLRADPQVQLYFATQFFLWFGINAITPFLTLYAKKEAHFDDSHALILSFILLLSSAIFNVPFGQLGDRLGLKRIFFFGMICMAGAAVAGIFTKEALPLYLILTVAGIGNAAQTASSYPLLTRIVQPDQMGLYTGLASTVTSIAAPASALITGALIQSFGYVTMFPFVAAMFIASLIPLALLHPERSIAARTRAVTAGPAVRTLAE
ncbi:MAG TPA: MFS transporter [Ktedonobacterales bacterium]